MAPVSERQYMLPLRTTLQQAWPVCGSTGPRAATALPGNETWPTPQQAGQSWQQGFRGQCRRAVLGECLREVPWPRPFPEHLGCQMRPASPPGSTRKLRLSLIHCTSSLQLHLHLHQCTVQLPPCFCRPQISAGRGLVRGIEAHSRC